MKSAKRSFAMVFAAAILAMLLIPSSASMAQPQTMTPIKHVVYIMKENQSFDDYFGTYPYGNNKTLMSNPIVKELSVPYGIQNGTNSIEVPNYPGLGWLLGYTKLRYLDGVTQVDPGEGWVDYHGDWDWGRMNGFVAYSGPQSMVYVTYQQLPWYWDYAEEYVLCDNYFTPVMTETAPNRLASLTGYAPISNDYGPPPYVPLNETIFYQLTQHNISWGYFELFSTTRDPPSSEIYPLDYITGFTSNLTYMNNVENLSVFFQLAKEGKLPAVSFVMPFGITGENGIPDPSEHPPANITLGQDWTVNIVNAVEESPDWNTSVIFITWDEFGGFYDNVPPPQVNSFGYGERVPLLIISPYAKENYVDPTVLNHDSVLKFIEYNWNLPYLTSWVAESGSVLSAFDFNQPPRPPIILGPTPDAVYTPGASHGVLYFENGSAYYITSSNPNFDYPLPLQIPLSELTYSSPPYQLPSSTAKFSLPPSWLASYQFFTIIASIVLIAVALVLQRKGMAMYSMVSAGLSIVVTAISSALGIVYPAIPQAPVPPTEPTYSFLTAIGMVLLAISALAAAFPYIRRYLPKPRGGFSEGMETVKALAVAGSIIAFVGFALTPGVFYPVPGIQPSELAPPPTLISYIAVVFSPLTIISWIALAVSGLLVVKIFASYRLRR